MAERLQKIIASAGLMSRRAAEEAIRSGRVSCNGRIASLGETAEPGQDQICLDRLPVVPQEQKIYLMLHKPRGVVTSMNDEQGRRSVADLVKDVGARVYPVGRLDLDSEGLLLMTNDGDFANRVMHPSQEVSKCYETWVNGSDMDAAVKSLGQPMRIDGYEIRPATVRLLRRISEQEALLSITIHEGRNRQVRKMCESVGLRVTRLLRVSEGSLHLGDLPSGSWRNLTKEEIKSFER